MRNNTDFKNLRILPSGFQVTIMRNRIETSKHFPGHSVESYMDAIEYRNQLLHKLPLASRRGRPLGSTKRR